MTPKKPGKTPHETARCTMLAQCGFIRLGGHLCRLKAMCQYGEFEALAEKYCRMGASQRQAAMRVFREYGQKPECSGFSGAILGLLAYAPDPQAALEEAHSRKEAGEAVTAKIAREIAAAQKAQQEAEERAPPSHTRARDSNRLEFSPFRRPAPRGRTRHSIQNWIG